MTILFGRTQQCIDTPFEPLRNPGFGGVASPLTSIEAQSAIEEAYYRAIQDAQGVVRFVLTTMHNGTVGNGTFIGRSEVLPNTYLRFPRPIVINEIVWENATTGISGFLDIYKNGTAPGNLFTSFTMLPSGANTGQIYASLTLNFAANDTLIFRYRKVGAPNLSDLSIDLYCRVTG